MTALVFDTETFGWDFSRHAIAFFAYDGDRRVLCLIAGEALQDNFGAAGAKESMEAAFVANRAIIEAKARELYRAGRVDADGRVLLYGDEFFA